MQISPAFRRMLFCQYSQRSPAAVLECIRIRVGYVWTGQFDLNMDTCRRGNFESGRKVPDSKISGHVWARRRGSYFFQLAFFMVVNSKYAIVAKYIVQL